MSFSSNTLPINHALLSCDVCSVLGEGGFGIVYRAWDRQLERFIAVKEYMPSALAVRGDKHCVKVKSADNLETFEAGRKSFLNEARMVARFEHHSVVKIYQFWEENETAYIAMPLYEGKTLRDVLRARTAAPDEAWIKALVLPLLDALTLIHAHQCYHRDIAPDNIIVLEDESPVLIDFGAARRVIGDMTQALTAVLKPGFAPIEQYADSTAVAQGPWTDIYALSAVVHYALVGKAPPTSVARVMNDTYEPLERRLAGRYSAEFLKALDQGLIVSPTARTQTAEQFKTSLFGAENTFLASNNRTFEPTQQIQPSKKLDLITTNNVSPDAEQILSFNPVYITALSTQEKQKTAHSSNNRPPAKSHKTKLALFASTVAATAILLFVFTGPKSPDTFKRPETISAKLSSNEAPRQQLPAPISETTLNLENFHNYLRSRSTQSEPLVVQTSKQRYLVENDKVSFKLNPTADGFVYIFLVNASGKAQLVFPNSSEKNNAVTARTAVNLPRNNNFIASAPLGKSSAVVLLSANKRNFDAILDFPPNDFPEISAKKLKNLDSTGEQARALGVILCATKNPSCEIFSVSRVEFETYR
jgi:serine/threonine protein kinase